MHSCIKPQPSRELILLQHKHFSNSTSKQEKKKNQKTSYYPSLSGGSWSVKLEAAPIQFQVDKIQPTDKSC
jgi:hypothetical protein